MGPKAKGQGVCCAAHTKVLEFIALKSLSDRPKRAVQSVNACRSAETSCLSLQMDMFRSNTSVARSALVMHVGEKRLKGRYVVIVLRAKHKSGGRRKGGSNA